MSLIAFRANLEEARTKRDTAKERVEGFRAAGLIYERTDPPDHRLVAKNKTAGEALRDLYRYAADARHWKEELYRMTCESAGIAYVPRDLREQKESKQIQLPQRHTAGPAPHAPPPAPDSRLPPERDDD